MKIVLFVLFALGCFYINSHASSLEGKASNEVEMTVKYHDPTAGNNDMPRGPVEIPQVFIDSYTLYINSSTFHNNPLKEGYLPQGIQYKEYVVPTHGTQGPGLQRIVIGSDGAWYYTPDHYKTYIRFKP